MTSYGTESIGLRYFLRKLGPSERSSQRACPDSRISRARLASGIGQSGLSRAGDPEQAVHNHYFTFTPMRTLPG